MAATPSNDEDRRRAALEAVGIDPDMFLQAERAAASMPAPTRPGLNPLPADAPSFPTNEPNAPPDPQPCRPLTDHEHEAFCDLIPSPFGQATLSNRAFVNGMISVVVGGHGWQEAQSYAPGVRERYRRERRRPHVWAEVERRVMLLLSSPTREHVVRVCRFIVGDRSVRARRPDPGRLARGISKFDPCRFPTAAPVWTPEPEQPKRDEAPLPRRASKSWSRNVRPA